MLGLGLILGAVLGRCRLRSEEEDLRREAPSKGFVTESGLRYFDFATGEGPNPKWGDFVQLSYVVYTVTKSGAELFKEDSTYDRKHKYLIHHGNGQTILGVEEALHSMQAGGRRRVIVPPTLAYVQAGLGPIPPEDWRRRRLSKHLREGNGLLVFDLELHQIMPDPDDRGYYTDLTPTPEEVTQIFQQAIQEADT